MQENALFCKNALILYMKDLLENNITKDEYYDLSERCYSMYGSLLETYYPCFNKVFMEVVPDACLYYIDEPGLDDFKKEELFRKEIDEVYNKVITM